MINETTKNIEQLIEINRALAHDLDVSRRFIAEISRERDALRNEIDTLMEKWEQAAVNAAPAEMDMMKRDLANQQRQITHMVEQRQGLIRETKAAMERKKQAEERLRLLLHKFHEMKDERDAYAIQLEESTAAMSEIKNQLTQMPQGAFAAALWQ